MIQRNWAKGNGLRHGAEQSGGMGHGALTGYQAEPGSRGISWVASVDRHIRRSHNSYWRALAYLNVLYLWLNLDK